MMNKQLEGNGRPGAGGTPESEPAVAAVRARPSLSAPVGAARSAKRRLPLVFVVDDDVTTNRMLQGILTRAGFATAGAFDCAGALSGIREQGPDLVLLDLSLPDGSGLDVCRSLHTGPGARTTPVLFISSNEDLSAKIQGFEAGGVDYIPKPLAGEEVIARVSTHLRLKQAYEDLAEMQAERIQRLAVAQEMLMPLPGEIPEAHFQVSLRQVLTAGGDFYDVIPVGNRVADYVVADASGHDLAASFWTAALKTLLGQYATLASSPLEVVRSMNGALCRMLPESVFFTLLYARLNRQSGKLSLVNAGHPPALVVPRTGEPIAVIHQEGDVVGAFPDATFGMTEVKVRSEDRFFLVSDGLLELKGNRQEGLGVLAAACGRHRVESLADMVVAVPREVVAESNPQDDMLLLGVEV